MKRRFSFKSEIVLHLLIWICLYGLMVYQDYSRLGKIDLLSNRTPRFLVDMGMFYLNYYILVSYLLLKKKIFWYVISCIGSILLVSYLIDLWIPSERFMNSHFKETFGVHPDFSPPPIILRESYGFFMKTLIGPSVNLLLYFILGAIVRIYVEWNKNERLREKIDSEKVSSELQFLKAQLNPHFLFNSLNAVYTLSIKKSPDTSEAILNLSELMRYMIYEADRDKVKLEKELNYIKNYIQLQRLRLVQHEDVIFNIYGDSKEKEIHPMLFISFIENAFKYGTDYKGFTHVKIAISISENQISLFVRNKIGTFRKTSASSGIGLENVQNRLELLYPDQHELQIDNDGVYYTVQLTIAY